jgi:hypothetical protein
MGLLQLMMLMKIVLRPVPPQQNRDIKASGEGRWNGSFAGPVWMRTLVW